MKYEIGSRKYEVGRMDTIIKRGTCRQDHSCIYHNFVMFSCISIQLAPPPLTYASSASLLWLPLPNIKPLSSIIPYFPPTLFHPLSLDVIFLDDEMVGWRVPENLVY